MEVVIAVEGDEPRSEVSYIFLPGSLVWKDEPLPVTEFFNHEKPPIGKAENLRRDGNKVVADITLFHKDERTIDPELVDFSMSVSPFVCKDGTNDVVSAKIREISIIGRV